MPRRSKDAALHAMADALVAATDEVLAANAHDVDAARADGTSDTMLDRLALTAERVTAMADGLRAVAALPDPVGDVVRGYTVPNGLRIEQVRVPLGVVAIVYEARPNVTVDAAGLAVKSGNAALLRGSATAYESNTVLVDVLAGAAEKAARQCPARARHGPFQRRASAAGARVGGRDHPAGRRRADLLRGRELHRAGDRDRGRQLSRLRRRQR